jgi:pimeloyl-ACP methyl ester carboxylesterase
MKRDTTGATETLYRRRLLQALGATTALGLAGSASAASTAVSTDRSPTAGKNSAQSGRGSSFEQSGLDRDVFSEDTVEVDDLSLHYVIGGEGPPLVLLHGWPETWFEWKEVMPALAEQHTIVAMDYRGAGGSDAPSSGYDKQTMAADIKGAVDELGYDQVGLVGHDIGGMVGYAFANEYPATLDRFAILDVPLPGIEPFWSTVQQLVWHFGFQAVPELPEAIVGNDLRTYLAYFYDSFGFQDAIDRTDRQVYTSAYRPPEYLTAGFELYRAFSTDVEQNKQYAKTSLEMPVLGLYGTKGPVTFLADMMNQVATDVQGGPIAESGHFIPEEQPEALSEDLLAFFGEEQ